MKGLRKGELFCPEHRAFGRGSHCAVVHALARLGGAEPCKMVEVRMTFLKGLGDHTYSQIEKALYKVGGLREDASSINMRQRWRVSGKAIVVESQLYGMGHSEGNGPIGPMDYKRYTEAELFGTKEKT